MNKTLQLALKNEFKKKGILAYTNCCRWGCTGAYDEEDDFKERETKGIYFIRLHTDGMNYNPQPTFTTALYGDFDYLMDNWAEECTILDKWCEVGTSSCVVIVILLHSLILSLFCPCLPLSSR
jgi:hypothetical protein